jgi:TonB family protein
LLKNVFIVLEISDQAGKTLFLTEVGTLRPYEVVPVKATIPVPAAMGVLNYQIHVFSGGSEVFNSAMPFDYREGMLDRMVYKRIQNALGDSPPKVFVGPAPEYPKQLRDAGRKGDAVITIRITAKGAVLDPVVRRASDPAFGEAAVVAVRQWRYLPMMRFGQPIETSIDVPFAFAPSGGR